MILKGGKKLKKEENILGTEKIGKLIRKFSVPCIIALLVNSLYNIVDQIFIGWGVGYLGNGATNVVFPITMICLALGQMFGDGASAYLSLKLGENKKDEASKGVGNGICLSAITSVIFCAIVLIFLPQLLNLFGCTDALREYATDYGFIIAMGLPFMMLSVTLSSIIRADGSPAYSMISMLTGAILNIILNPIFIFVCHMGVAGSALATVISQILTFIINIVYMRKVKTITLDKNAFKLKRNIAKKTVTLGISSFITNISIVIVMAVENNLLGKYGAESKYGSEVPITVLGIVMKISQILNSIIIGIAVGAQPIIGYNYGAKKYNRVWKTLKIVLGLSVIVSTIAFILFKAIPDKLISIFGSGDEDYIEFACIAFRTYLMLCICNGIQIPTGIFFQSIGKSTKSAMVSLSRQIILLIPAMLILSSIFGLMGVLYAGPVADGIAFLIGVSLLAKEIKRIKDETVVSGLLVDSANKDNRIGRNIVVTISREYGSGGRYVGKLIADKLGIKFYDKNFIERVAQETGLSEEYIETNEEKRTSFSSFNNGYYAGLNNADDLFVKETNTIRKLADEGSCVIVGRCADFVLKEREDVVKVFIYSNMQDKIKRATEFYGLDKKKAEKEINKINRLRANHYKYYTEKDWKNPNNYDICINSDTLGVEKTADLICNMIKEKDLILV